MQLRRASLHRPRIHVDAHLHDLQIALIRPFQVEDIKFRYFDGELVRVRFEDCFGGCFEHDCSFHGPTHTTWMVVIGGWSVEVFFSGVDGTFAITSTVTCGRIPVWGTVLSGEVNVPGEVEVMVQMREVTTADVHQGGGLLCCAGRVVGGEDLGGWGEEGGDWVVGWGWGWGDGVEGWEEAGEELEARGCIVGDCGVGALVDGGWVLHLLWGVRTRSMVRERMFFEIGVI